MFLAFWKGSVLNRITGHQFPLDRLIKGVAEQLVDFFNCPRGDKTILGHSIRPSFGLYRFELLIEMIHHPGIDVIQLFVPNQGPDVIVDQRLVALVGRGCPGIDAVNGNVLI